MEPTNNNRANYTMQQIHHISKQRKNVYTDISISTDKSVVKKKQKYIKIQRAVDRNRADVECEEDDKITGVTVSLSLSFQKYSSHTR
jgi:hypothetical protein